MGNNSTATVVAFATTVPTWLAVTDLEVISRAGLQQADIRGQACSETGAGTDFGAQKPQTSPLSQQSSSSLSARELSARIRVARYGSAIRSLNVMDNVQLSKPRTGYHATSGTG